MNKGYGLIKSALRDELIFRLRKVDSQTLENCCIAALAGIKVKYVDVTGYDFYARWNGAQTMFDSIFNRSQLDIRCTDDLDAVSFINVHMYDLHKYKLIKHPDSLTDIYDIDKIYFVIVTIDDMDYLHMIAATYQKLLDEKCHSDYDKLSSIIGNYPSMTVVGYYDVSSATDEIISRLEAFVSRIEEE